MTSEGLGVMFEGNSADTCGGKFPLVSMGVGAECPACANTGARTPIGASGIHINLLLVVVLLDNVAQNHIRVYCRILIFCMGS